MESKLQQIEVAVEGLGKIWIPDNESHIRIYRGEEYVAVTPDEVTLHGETLTAGRIEAGRIRRRGARCAEVRRALQAANIYTIG